MTEVQHPGSQEADRIELKILEGSSFILDMSHLGPVRRGFMIKSNRTYTEDFEGVVCCIRQYFVDWLKQLGTVTDIEHPLYV